MDTGVRLNDADVRAIVDRILGDRWRSIGYDHSEVVSEDDVYGEPALTVTAWLKDGAPSIPVDLYSHTLLDLRGAIRAEGEQRYAYLRLRHPDDQLDVADDTSDLP